MANLLVDSGAPSSNAAISITRNYLQNCIDSWEANEYPRRSDCGRDWWRDWATGANTDIAWSARYLGTDILGPLNIRLERWAVIGAGLERVGEELVPVPGT